MSDNKKTTPQNKGIPTKPVPPQETKHINIKPVKTQNRYSNKNK